MSVTSHVCMPVTSHVCMSVPVRPRWAETKACPVNEQQVSQFLTPISLSLCPGPFTWMRLRLALGLSDYSQARGADVKSTRPISSGSPSFSARLKIMAAARGDNLHWWSASGQPIRQWGVCPLWPRGGMGSE